MTPAHPQHTHEKRLFVLDTNVLIHDPSALFRFHEHDVFLPMVVL
ncbi:MAG TPA: PIN domain-containing protein, partial [Thiolinea sp.]|nr:PIN domain-containing protein [Thiolinea sp.]